MRKIAPLTVIIVVFLAAFVYGWTNCPPASLVTNPNPVVSGAVGTDDCLFKTNWHELYRGKEMSKAVRLEASQSYWFTASKCARGSSIEGWVKDEQGKTVKSKRGSIVAFCFKVPRSGNYTVGYRVEVYSGYSFAITSSCLSKSKC